MKLKVLLLLFISTASLALSAQPESAASIMKKAQQQAAAEKKNVFVMFHASWCIWCHRMDTSMNDASCRDYFKNNYVVVHMTVSESDTVKHPDTPGAQEMMNKYYGAGLGIPYWLIFDKNGSLLADSKIRTPDQAEAQGDNIGCPATADEVEAFIVKLKKTSVLSDAQADAIRKRFRQNEH
jgi:thioredoxin-related protein